MGITERPRLIVLTGFLGSGKTTFLTRFIEEQAAKNGFVAVVQNEIGKKGLDGKLLGQSYAVTEVDEGCVCCTLAGSLRSALSGILGEFQPDFVVLETTGLANPANLLAEIVDLDDMLDFASVTTLLDAACAPRALTEFEVARNQVQLADVHDSQQDRPRGRGCPVSTWKDGYGSSTPRPNCTARHMATFRPRSSTASISASPCGVRLPCWRPLGTMPRTATPASRTRLSNGKGPLTDRLFRTASKGCPGRYFVPKAWCVSRMRPIPEIFQYVPGHHALTPSEEFRDPNFLVIIGQDAARVADEFRREIGA